jgi:putative transcriptional regulator
MSKTFDMIMRGLDDVEDYLDGQGEGHVVHIPDEVDVKAIRRKLKLSQPKFAETFGFSVGRIRDWEQKRFPVDAPSRIFLTVIEREPVAVFRALSADQKNLGGAKKRVAAKPRPPKAIARG